MTRTVICVGFDGERTEVPVSALTFRPSVYGVIVRDDKVLLSSQWDGWDFPGGGMHPGETMDEAFEREVREETGLSASRGKLLHVAEAFFTHPNTKKHYHTLLLYFEGLDAKGEISTAHLSEDEKIYVREARWIPIKDLHTLKFYNSVDSIGIIEKARDRTKAGPLHSASSENKDF